jgi:hypothetical protein
MDKVILGIETGDRACAAVGIDFLHEDQGFPFGAILKSRTARALRRAHRRGELSNAQCDRIRSRIVAMLLAGNTPRELKEYAKLARHIGLGSELTSLIEHEATGKPSYSTRRYLAYFKRFVS